MRGDFDALLSVSPKEGPAQHQIPVILTLRKKNSFVPQGSLDSAASFVSAASSASEPDSVKLVPGEATSSAAADAGQVATVTRDIQAANGTALTCDAQSDLKDPSETSGEDLDLAALDEEHRSGTAESLVPGHSLNGTKDTDSYTSSQMQGSQQKSEEPAPSAVQHLPGQGNKPSSHHTSEDAANSHLGASTQPEHDDPLRCASRATNSTNGHATSTATDASDDMHVERQSDAAAPLQQLAVHESGSPSQRSTNDSFEEALEAMQLQPRASAELPVSTMRAGRCLSGYASAEDEPPQPARQPTNSSGTFSAAEHDLLAAASRAGQGGGHALTGSNPNDESETWPEHAGTTDEGRLGNNAEAPQSSSWGFTDAMAADEFHKGTDDDDDDEGQELSALRGSGQEAEQASVAGSSPDSHAAASYELHSIARDISVPPPIQVRTVCPRDVAGTIGSSNHQGHSVNLFREKQSVLFGACRLMPAHHCRGLSARRQRATWALQGKET